MAVVTFLTIEEELLTDWLTPHETLGSFVDVFLSLRVTLSLSLSHEGSFVGWDVVR